MEQTTETGEVMTTWWTEKIGEMSWQQLLEKQERERANFLLKYAKRDMSRISGARKLRISLTYMTKLINKYNIDWPTRQSQREGVGIRKVPGGIDTYKQMAEAGLTQAEMCRKFGVSSNNVSRIARVHNIKFADGRRKQGPRNPKIRT